MVYAFSPKYSLFMRRFSEHNLFKIKDTLYLCLEDVNDLAHISSSKFKRDMWYNKKIRNPEEVGRDTEYSKYYKTSNF